MIKLRTAALAMVLGVAFVPVAQAVGPGLPGGAAVPAFERSGTFTQVHHHPDHLGGYGAEERGICNDGRPVDPQWGCWVSRVYQQPAIVPWQPAAPPSYRPPPRVYYETPAYVPRVRVYDPPPAVIEVSPTPRVYYSPYR